MIRPLSTVMVNAAVAPDRDLPIIIYRLAEQKDAPIMADLLNVSTGGFADLIWSEQAKRSSGRSARAVGVACFDQEDAGISLLNGHIALHKNQPVGMMYAYGPGEAHHPLSLTGERMPEPMPFMALDGPDSLHSDSLHIAALAVISEMQGQAIGHGLLDVAISRARKLGLQRVSVVCCEANLQAMAFFRSHGFAVVKRAEIPSGLDISYQGDALLLVRDLSQPIG